LLLLLNVSPVLESSTPVPNRLLLAWLVALKPRKWTSVLFVFCLSVTIKKFKPVFISLTSAGFTLFVTNITVTVTDFSGIVVPPIAVFVIPEFPKIGGRYQIMV